MSEHVVPPEQVAAQDEADGASYMIRPTDPELAEQLDQIQEEPEPNALTMFVIVVQSDGTAVAFSDLSVLTDVVPAREATLSDIRNGAQQAVHDANAIQIAQHTAGLMQQTAMQMAEQQRSEKIAAKLAERGIKVPNGGHRSGR